MIHYFRVPNTQARFHQEYMGTRPTNNAVIDPKALEKALEAYEAKSGDKAPELSHEPVRGLTDATADTDGCPNCHEEGLENKLQKGLLFPCVPDKKGLL